MTIGVMEWCWSLYPDPVSVTCIQFTPDTERVIAGMANGNVLVCIILFSKQILQVQSWHLVWTSLLSGGWSINTVRNDDWLNQKVTNHCIPNSPSTWSPAWPGASPFPLFPSLSIHFLIFCSFYFSLFPFLIHFVCFLLSSISSLSTRIVPLCFQAGGCRKRPNLGLVFCVYFVLSVLLS